MLRADQLGLDNLPAGSSLEKTDSPSLSSHYVKSPPPPTKACWLMVFPQVLLSNHTVVIS